MFCCTIVQSKTRYFITKCFATSFSCQKSWEGHLLHCPPYDRIYADLQLICAWISQMSCDTGTPNYVVHKCIKVLCLLAPKLYIILLLPEKLRAILQFPHGPWRGQRLITVSMNSPDCTSKPHMHRLSIIDMYCWCHPEAVNNHAEHSLYCRVPEGKKCLHWCKKIFLWLMHYAMVPSAPWSNLK